MKRNTSIDILKGIALLAVILYHLLGGIFPYGYLGVDVFFVISGYLMTNSAITKLDKGVFSYRKFIFDKLLRLLPLLVIISAFSMIMGYFLMLPDDYENLSESVIASLFFVNNVLSCITTKNYWHIDNLFKPLMHTWYISLLLQAYIVLILIILIIYKIFINKKAVRNTLAVITILSLVLYLLPYFPTEHKFYYLPFRLFELSAGGLIVFLPKAANSLYKQINFVKYIFYIFLLTILFVNNNILENSGKLLLTVFFTIGLVYIFTLNLSKPLFIFKPFEIIGKASYSVYLWHQVFIAFIYYSFVQSLTAKYFVIFALITLIFSALTYRFIELPIHNINLTKNKLKLLIAVFAASILLCTAAFFIYFNAGVVRDVPELSIYKDNIHRGMHAEYNAGAYRWDKDFSDKDNIKVLIIGNSFARDWANILYESSIYPYIEISYISNEKDIADDSLKDRLNRADYIFNYYNGYEADDKLLSLADKDKLYILGYKTFGKSNGIVYRHRDSQNYFNITLSLSNSVLDYNLRAKQKYGNHFIDLITPIQTKDGSIRIFTDNNKFISQDCKHLTEDGAEYYAKILDLSWILNN